MKIRLQDMNVAQATVHYGKLQSSRFAKASEVRLAATWQGGKRSLPRKLMEKEAARLQEKAEALSRPRRTWQLDRAVQLKDRYGLMVAAGFLKAHGWSLESVVYTLGLPDRG